MEKLVRKTVVMLMVVGLTSSVLAVPVTNGLVLQLDMSDVSTTDVGGIDYVTSWNDQSGNDNDALQAASGLQPVLVGNITPLGGSAIKFDGADDYLDIVPDSTFDGGSFTMFAVYAVDAFDTGSGTRRILNLGYADIDPGTTVKANTTTYSMIAGGATTGIRAFSRNVGGTAIYANSGIPTGYAADTFYIAAAKMDSASTNIFSYLVDQAGNVYSASNTGANAVGSGNTVARIGAGTTTTSATTPGSFMNGWISEVLIYNRVLSGTEITSVDEYLNAKYIIPEPATISLLAMGIMGLSVRRRK